MSFMFKRIMDAHDAEIKAIKEGISATRRDISDLEVRIERDFVGHNTYEQYRRENRESVINLHTKVEKLAADIHTKIDSAALETRTRLDRIMEELMRRRDSKRTTD